jgi:hypothetical protein
MGHEAIHDRNEKCIQYFHSENLKEAIAGT